VPENQFLATMGFFSGSLSESCEFCHKSEITWEAYAQDNDMKNMARRMVIMMNGINQAYFGGKREVTCYTCHRNSAIPKVTPTFADIYNPNPAPMTRTRSPNPSPVPLLRNRFSINTCV